MRGARLTIAGLLALALVSACESSSAPAQPHPSGSRPTDPMPVVANKGLRAFTVSTGRGDVDGDGRPDRVVVSTPVNIYRRDRGVVRVQFADGRTRTFESRGLIFARYEGVSDLDGDGRGEVLTWTSATGCCQPYPNAYGVSVVTYDGNRLRFVRLDKRPLSLGYDAGRGDEYAGFTCQGGTITQRIAQIVGVAQRNWRLRISTRLIAMHGAQAEATSQSQTVQVGSGRALERVRCRGLNEWGFDPKLKDAYGKTVHRLVRSRNG
jgi:hypothetical protein